jgi:hypothetical protein
VPEPAGSFLELGPDHDNRMLYAGKPVMEESNEIREYFRVD